VKSFLLHVHPSGSVLALHGAKWMWALWLIPLPAFLYFAIPAELSSGALGEVRLSMIIASLKGPFTLFEERSPGTRRVGNLIVIKGKGTPLKRKSGPHERVLAFVRERPVPFAPDTASVVLDLPVVLDIPPGALLPIPSPPPQLAAAPQYEITGAALFAPASPFVFTGSAPGEIPAPAGPPLPPVVGFIPGGTVPTTPNSPQVSPPVGGTTPGGTPGTSPGGVTIVLPEPAPWTMTILGLFAMGAISRRRIRKPRTGLREGR